MIISIFVVFYLTTCTSALRCFSNICTHNHTACIQHCPIGSEACHLVRHTNRIGSQTILDLSCTNSLCHSHDCILNSLNISNVDLAYCCCTGDLCNRVDGFTDIVDPVHNLTTQSPPVAPPVRSSDVLICEKYNCSIGNDQPCYHGYEVCSETIRAPGTNAIDHSCFSSYKPATDTSKLSLFYKGCLYNELYNHQSVPCNESTTCHIDNPLVVTDPNQLYFCCCNSSFCNGIETFTHETELSIYGLDACLNKGCNHSCSLSNNRATCYCPEGFALVNETECVDINECLTNNGGCDDFCVNRPGTFTCECGDGRILQSNARTCIDYSGLFCINGDCQNGSEPCIQKVQACGLPDENGMLSGPDYQYCAVFYKKSSNGSFHLPFYTCYRGSHDNCNDECILERSHEMFEIYFCCCNNDFCNADSRVVFPNNSISTSDVSPTSTSVYYDSSTITPSGTTDSGPPAEVAIYASVFTCIIVVGIAIIIALIIGIALFQFNYNNRLDPDRETINSHRETPSPPLCVVDPKIIKTIAQGRFAKVCLATCGNIEVAIKMFNNTIPAKDSWNQEKNIYETPNLEHANILKFIDSEQRDYKGTCTYWLKFDYHPLGSLYDYLQEHNISLIELTLLAKSAACGLAHLHSEIASNGILVKPAITHRDLKSKNILVKNDLTCCISDFGLAIKFIPGEHAFDEAKGQVGTSRYMAPEVLEGAISFNQESFLRIDVYAFGLILWEMTNMCIVSNDPVMKYKPPFDGLVSPNPSIEEMKLVVATERKRPDIPQGFLNMQNCDRLIETITESWDSDAEARPTAHLIESRLDNLYHAINSPKDFKPKTKGLGSFENCSSDINTPLPPTPSYSPSVTMSPTEFKTHGLDFDTGSSSFYTSSYLSSPQRNSLISDQCNGSANTRPVNIILQTASSNNDHLSSFCNESMNNNSSFFQQISSKNLTETSL